MKKIKIMILFIVLGIILSVPNIAHAGYQSKPGTTILMNKAVSTFFLGCREMETAGGVLGLEEELDTDYTGKTKNGIDAHMALNTEWGTIALLTNSQYGVGNGIRGTSNNSTSTGNKTGIYGLASSTYECVAGIYEGTNVIKKDVNSRYFNKYSAKIPKLGDALDCNGWLSSSYISWVTSSNPVFYRDSGLFGAKPYYGGESNIGTRAVVVCGAGL